MWQKTLHNLIRAGSLVLIFQPAMQIEKQVEKMNKKIWRDTGAKSKDAINWRRHSGLRPYFYDSNKADWCPNS